MILLIEGCLPQCMLGVDTPRNRHPSGVRPPWVRHPPRSDTPRDRHPPGSRHPPHIPRGSRHFPRSRHPPGTDNPPRACWEIWSTRGRHASYWNAILLSSPFTTDLSDSSKAKIPDSVTLPVIHKVGNVDNFALPKFANK